MHDLQIQAVLVPELLKGYVFIETAKAVDRINVYSSTGKLYFTIPRPHRSDAGVSIDISGLTTGVFMVEVVSGTERQVRKLIKE